LTVAGETLALSKEVEFLRWGRLYRIAEHIPRLRQPFGLDTTGDWLRQHGPAVSGVAAVLVVLMLFSTRLISVLLKLDLPLLGNIAPFFYLTSFGRWKLHRRYRGCLAQYDS
jgi:hypothetical protein